MPSQNLPKPNLPGQVAPSDTSNSGLPGQINQLASNGNPPVGNTPVNAQTVFSQKPPQAQTIPGGLSRENPGGTPPDMKVSAPAPSVSQDQLSTTQPPKPIIETTKITSRPLSPLGQISLSNSPLSPKTATVEKPVLASVTNVSSANTVNTVPSAPSTVPKPSTVTTPSTVTNVPTSVNVAGVVENSENTDSEKKASLGFLSSLKSKKIPLPLLIGGGVLVLILIAFLLFSLFKPKAKPSTKTKTPSTNTSNSTATTSATTGQISTVTYWGLWEDSQILKEVIADFESQNPTIKIDYRKQSHRDYRERLQQAILSGNGPDIFRYHVAWVPMLSADLSPMPASVMSVAQYKEIFYPTASNNLQVNGQIVGIPLMYDGLALFYNKEMLKTANIDVPKTWAELRTAANKLTVPANVNERSNITRAGLAIGNAGNVDHFSDILALLIIQNGGNPSDATSQYVKDAITFYTNFIKQDKVWSDRLANSTVAFARGDVAMIFAPSWRAHDIKSINPELDFAVTGVPQLDADNPMTWASFWAEGVSAKSKNKEAAWTFLKYLSTPEVLRKFYNNASQYRTFGEIYPRVDMASELQTSELVGAYINDAPLAKSWYMSSFTHDNGINDQIIKYYEDAINTVLSGSDTEKALETAKTGIGTVLSKYTSVK